MVLLKLLSILFLVKFTNQAVNNDASQVIDFNTLINIFQINNKNAFDTIQSIIRFDASTKLIYPSDLNKFMQQKRGIIEAYGKRAYTNLVFKFEMSDGVRQWWPNKEDKDRIPMEIHVSRLVERIPEFIRYFNNSMAKIPVDGVRFLYIYSMEKINDAKDLSKWAAENRHLQSVALQQLVKTFFRTILQCLKILKDNSLIYTDLKPENILISGGKQAYLIDLESVMVLHQSQNYIYTPGYIPRSEVKISMDRLNDAVNSAADRMLTFSFCMSMYVVVCGHGKPPKLLVGSQSLNEIDDYYKGNCGDYDGISERLRELFRHCLPGYHAKNKQEYTNQPYQFSDLLKNSWFKI